MREKTDYCHICDVLGHDTLICKLRAVQCAKCGSFGHDRSACLNYNDSKPVKRFFETQDSSQASTIYSRLVNVQDSLISKEADTDRMIMLEPKDLI